MDIGRERDAQIDKTPKLGSVASESIETGFNGGVRPQADLPVPGGTGDAFLAGLDPTLVKSLRPLDRVIKSAEGNHEVVDGATWEAGLPAALDTDPGRYLSLPVITADLGVDFDPYRFPPPERSEWWDAAKAYVKEQRQAGVSQFPFGRVFSSIPKLEGSFTAPMADAKGFLEIASSLPGWELNGRPAVAIDFGIISELSTRRLAEWRSLVLKGANASGYGMVGEDGQLQYVDTSRASLASLHPANLKMVCESLNSLGYGDGYHPCVPFGLPHIETGRGSIVFDYKSGMVTYQTMRGEAGPSADLAVHPWRRLMNSNSWRDHGAAIIAAELMAKAGEADPIEFEEEEFDGFKLTFGVVGERIEGMAAAKSLYVLRVESRDGWDFESCGISSPRWDGMDSDGLRRLVVTHLEAMDESFVAEDALMLGGSIDDHYGVMAMASPAVEAEWSTRAELISTNLAFACRERWRIEAEG